MEHFGIAKTDGTAIMRNSQQFGNDKKVRYLLIYQASACFTDLLTLLAAVQQTHLKFKTISSMLKEIGLQVSRCSGFLRRFLETVS